VTSRRKSWKTRNRTMRAKSSPRARRRKRRLRRKWKITKNLKAKKHPLNQNLRNKTKPKEGQRRKGRRVP